MDRGLIMSCVHILAILDRSGSMSGMQTEVINSFNEFMREQKTQKGKAKLTLVLFDNQYEVIYDRVNIKKVPELTSEKYFARGMTSMNDAIGKAVTSLSDCKDVVVLIQTDGMENSSKEWTKESVKSLIQEKEAVGWDFNFIGANIDAQDAAASYGITKAGIQMDFSAKGFKDAFGTISTETSVYRTSKL